MDMAKKKHVRIDDGSKRSNVCCYHLKEKPLRLLHRRLGFTHCFTGLTAMESRRRMFTACQFGMEYYAKKDEITKVHPIMFWTPEEVQSFLNENEVPVTPIYEKYGMMRTGCLPCVCYIGWKEQLSRINPRLYKMVMKRYFDQQTF
jgi:3'-phosphoadenosine 5'-phosphosulfate sulfotransferase (PAPS reductase)/FAD synthetase